LVDEPRKAKLKTAGPTRRLKRLQMSETLATAWPVKEAEYFDAVMDSTQWNGFAFRDDDIVVATYPKCGTTLTQQILGQLLLGPDPLLYGAAQDVSPWIDFRPTPDARNLANAQTRRRYLKTHLARHHLPLSPRARYVVVLRDPRDVAWSFHNHLTGFNPEFQAQIDANSGGQDYPVFEDVRDYYHAFLDGQAQQQPYWSFVQGWWDVRILPNVLLVHYGDVIGDMGREIARIAQFIEAPVDEAKLAAILPLCTIGHMRQVAANDAFLSLAFKAGAETFINKGVNGRWRDVLSPAEIEKAAILAAKHLSPDCAAWVMR
jgi:aryl sulfotransferase